MIFFKKKLLPLILVSCIGASVINVGTCQAGWADWAKPSTIVNFFKNHKKLTIGGGILLGCVAAFAVYAIFFKKKNENHIKKNENQIKKNEKDISGLKQACKDNNIEKVNAILEHNKDNKDLENWILYGKSVADLFGESSPLLIAIYYENFESVKLLVEKLGIDKLVQKIDDNPRLLIGLAIKSTQRPPLVPGIGNDFYKSSKDSGVEIIKYLYENIYSKISEKSKIEFCKIIKLYVCEYGKLDLLKFIEKSKWFDSIKKAPGIDPAFGIFEIEDACAFGHLEIVQYLLPKIFTVSVGKTYAENEIKQLEAFAHIALDRGNFEIFSYIFRMYSVSVYAKDQINKKSLFLKVLFSDVKDNALIKFLANKSLTVNKLSREVLQLKENSFRYCYKNGDTEVQEIKNKLEAIGATLYGESSTSNFDGQRVKSIDFEL